MLKRQQTILYMLEKAGRPVQHLELVKWAFLLAHEMPSGGGSTFYEFVPYHYGPFSFTLFQELGKLVRDGYIKETQFEGQEAWERVFEQPASVGNLSQDVHSDTARVVDRFLDTPSKKLIDYVYEQFPWYTANSRIKRLTKCPKANPAVYTVGYEGLSIDGLLNTLLSNGIQRLVDVRRNPVARRYGFHKSSLTRLCGNVGIEYIHVPEVGIPSDLRQDLDSPEAYRQLFARYEREFLPKVKPAIQQISDLVIDRATALMCMEADPSMCHRTRLGQRIVEKTGLPLINIQVRKCETIMN